MHKSIVKSRFGMPKIISVWFSIFLCIYSLSGCKFIINLFAFYPDTRSVLTQDQLPDNVREIFIETDDQIKIQSYFIPHKTSDHVLIYFHGNAGNIGGRMADLLTLNRMSINILGVGYRGYGKSQGKPSEEGIYLDGKASLKYATEQLGFPLKKVILFGRSIGTAVAINTAQHQNISGLILITPLTSGKEHASTSILVLISPLAGDSFNNINKIGHIQCPLLVIHGTKDRVIPFSMGEKIYHKALVKKQFIKIEGAGHNNLSTAFKNEYWPPINNFLMALRSK